MSLRSVDNQTKIALSLADLLFVPAIDLHVLLDQFNEARTSEFLIAFEDLPNIQLFVEVPLIVF